jgi:aminoglycoside 3-N-acetyltransferase I
VFEDPASYADAPPGDEWCRDLLADPHVILLVAEDAGQVVGGIGAYMLRKFEQERSEVYIYDLAVAEQHRRRGIATALIAEIRRLARQNGAWMIFVQGDKGDEPALALYRKLAASEERPYHFDITP